MMRDSGGNARAEKKGLGSENGTQKRCCQVRKVLWEIEIMGQPLENRHV